MKHKVWALLIIVGMVILSGCRSVKYIPVPEYHHEYHHTTDSIFSNDTIIDYQQIIVREVDSATMAKYGIQLKDMQRAWLIESNRLQKEIQNLLKSRKDTIILRDSIPYPVPVEVKVPAQISWWQQTRIYAGDVMLVLLLLGAVYGIIRLIK